MDASIIPLHPLLMCLYGLILSLITPFIVTYKLSKHTHFVIIVFIEVEFVFISKSNLEQIVIKALFRNVDFFSSFLKWELFLLIFISDGSFIIFSPFNDFINNMPNSSFFGSSALTLLIHFLDVIFILIRVCGAIMLEGHQSMNHWHSHILGFYHQQIISFVILRSNSNVLVYGVNSTIYE